MLQPLEISDFSGGQTDLYLAGPLNCGQLFSNLLINNNKRPFTRPGSVLISEVHPQIPAGVARIGHLFDHRDQVFEQSGRNLYYFTTLFNTLLGPTGNVAFSANSNTNHISTDFWNNHTLLVSDSFALPIKVYKDGSGNFQVRTAGLPAIAAPTVTSTGGTGENYIYAFLYYYTYNVEGVVFEDFGSTVQVLLENVGAPDVNTVNITNIPVITNGLTKNYDTANIKVKIYRTETNQTVLKYIGEVTNGTTTYNDSASDASITDNVVIYTTGDVLDNDTPPPAKFVHIVNNIALYGYVLEDGAEVPNRIRQSIQGDIDSCPADFFDDLGDEITGISSVQSTFIVFTKSQTYRVDNFFDEQGRGGLVHQRISDTFGCVSNDSIVKVDDGLLFCSPQGWCFSDGYTVRKISNHLNATYQTFVSTTAQARNIYGAYDKIEKRVWWAVKARANSVDNDTCAVLDLNFGIREESSFTFCEGSTNFEPTALLFKVDDMYRADTRGFVFIHNAEHLTDPRVDIDRLPSTWAKATIMHDYKSSAFNFGTSFVRKFVPKILLTLANVTNIAIQMFSNNDDGKKVSALTEIRYNSNITWGDPDVVWGDPSIIWNKQGLIEEKRMMPVPGLRCNYKQIEIKNAYTIIENSDQLGTATVDSVAKTVTLDIAGAAWASQAFGYFISFDFDNYTRQFEIVQRNSDTVLTYFDPSDFGPSSGSYKWEMSGYRKGEVLQILSYTIHYKMLTDSQKPFHSGDRGENA